MELFQNMTLRNTGAMMECVRKGKKEGTVQKPMEVFEVIMQEMATYFTVLFEKYVLSTVRKAVLFGDILRRVTKKGNKLVKMTEYLEGVYFSVKSADTIDVLKRGQGPMKSNICTRTLQIIVKNSVIYTFDLSKSPGSMNNHRFMVYNDPKSVALKP